MCWYGCGVIHLFFLTHNFSEVIVELIPACKHFKLPQDGSDWVGRSYIVAVGPNLLRGVFHVGVHVGKERHPWHQKKYLGE